MSAVNCTYLSTSNVNSVGSDDETCWTLSVYVTYADATDNYPALNSMTGSFAAERSWVNYFDWPSDTYSTTENVDCRVIGHVDVGRELAIPYVEVLDVLTWSVCETCWSGLCVLSGSWL